MRINLTSVFVDDQDKALRFYTQVLGFQKKTEVPVGEYPVAHGGLTGGARRAGDSSWSRKAIPLSARSRRH